MATDIGIVNSKEKFKFRVCGLIERDGKYLFNKSSTSNVYHVPGGHVEIGEPSHKAVLREIKEEIKIDAKIEKLLCVNENIFIDGKKRLNHEIAYYFLLSAETAPKEDKFSITEIDKGVIKEQNFEWFGLDDARAFKLEPYFLRDLLLSQSQGTKFIITDERN